MSDIKYVRRFYARNGTMLVVSQKEACQIIYSPRQERNIVVTDVLESVVESAGRHFKGGDVLLTYGLRNGEHISQTITEAEFERVKALA